MANSIMSMGLIEDFMKAGLVPENCRRIVIDMSYDSIVTMYYETFPDGDKLREVGLPKKILKGGMEIKCVD